MSIARVIRQADYFLRRRDLLAVGYTDGNLREALARKTIFRVRQGWYSVPDAPEAAIRAVRVGGRLTSLSALESMGLPVPRQPDLHVAVRSTASRLRTPSDRRARLSRFSGVVVHWDDQPASDGIVWRVPVAKALLGARYQPRDIAVACCSAALRHRVVSRTELAAVFADAPARVRPWELLASDLDDSHGETFVRLWLADAGIACTQQPWVREVGNLDFRVAPHCYIEVDGGQHDPSWTGGGESSWERDHDRDTTMAIRGDRVLRFTYRQLYRDWPRVLAAIERAMSDDAALVARRIRHPYRPRVHRKRRRSVSLTPPL